MGPNKPSVCKVTSEQETEVSKESLPTFRYYLASWSVLQLYY